MARRDPNFPMQGKGGAMGGKYARKAENLTAKELKAAGGAKAAKKRTVSISDTKRVTSGANKGRTVGPGGKPLTGSVKLENGAMAVYKDGKRVTKAPARKPAAGPARSSSGGSSSSGGGGGRPTPPAQKNAPKVGEIRVGAAKKGVNRWDGKKWVPVSNTNATVRRTGTSTSSGGSSSMSKSAAMAKWNALTPAQKSNYRNNVSSFMRAMGLNPTAAAAKVVTGPNSTVSKVVSGSGSSSSSTPSRPQSATPGGARPGTPGYAKPKPKPATSTGKPRRDPRGGGSNAGGR